MRRSKPRVAQWCFYDTYMQGILGEYPCATREEIFSSIHFHTILTFTEHPPPRAYREKKFTAREKNFIASHQVASRRFTRLLGLYRRAASETSGCASRVSTLKRLRLG